MCAKKFTFYAAKEQETLREEEKRKNIREAARRNGELFDTLTPHRGHGEKAYFYGDVYGLNHTPAQWAIRYVLSRVAQALPARLSC